MPSLCFECHLMLSIEMAGQPFEERGILKERLQPERATRGFRTSLEEEGIRVGRTKGPKVAEKTGETGNRCCRQVLPFHALSRRF